MSNSRDRFAHYEGIAEGDHLQRDRASGPMTDPAAPAVLVAFDAAQDAGLPAVDCYRAGVEAWRHSYPTKTAAYAGSQAVAIILAARISLRVDDA